ncbi:MAG: glycosyltransferase family 2 protein [Sedimentisphaerales bacterium]|nr:glycosyltransferase family 2 protein [Sedimentisphaerales bacterium]
MSNTDVSIIVVSWNTRDILRNCLKSIYEQGGEVAFEVIVLDNASTDGSAEMVKQSFSQVILIENSENRGFAAANNQGIAKARGRYVLLLNSDTIILDKAVEKTISFADTHPEAAVVGCRVLNQDRTLQPTCFMFPSILNMLLSSTYLYKLFPKNKFFGRERMTWWNRNDIREVDVVTGCFMLVRREAIEQVGLMDERFFMYAEETDWCYHFKKAGWKIIFTPAGEIIHLGGQSSRQKQCKMILQLRGSILLFMKKNKCFLTYTLACLLVALFFFLRVPYWLVRAMFSPNSKRNYILIARTYFTGACKALLGAGNLC